ncbi:MAG: amidohydrolase family protein [Clostridia bacterium]|nr:amidohydrolase family protein [Clostridia bacterium]
MIIDFHTHVFPSAIAEKTINALQAKSNSTPYTNGTVEGLLQNMKNAGVDISVALPVLTKPTQFESVFNFAKSINEQFAFTKEKIISFAGMHPYAENIEQKMALIKENGFKGVKIHPDYQATDINDERYIKILKCAKENDLIVVTHSGVDDGFPNEPVRCSAEMVAKVIDKVNHDKFVLAHYGANRQWEKALELLAGKNVYFDTAYTFENIDREIFIKILEKHDTDKILFATDCPWQDMKINLKELYSYGLDPVMLDKILYKNARKLLRL